jgi:hypothetical protein
MTWTVLEKEGTSYRNFGWAESAKQYVARLTQLTIGIDGLWRRVLLAREGEKLVGQFGAALGCGACRSREGNSIVGKLELHDLQIAQHRGQQVVEIVRQERGHDAEHRPHAGLD